MGNQISTTGDEGQLPAAGTIIGFVSFAFTLATFLRVTWDNIQTTWNTTNEVHSSLPNLKQALFEERNHLRALRRRCRGQYEEGAFDVLAFGIREMVREFEGVEQAFLRPEFRVQDEKGLYSNQDPDDVYEFQYKRSYGLSDRWLWLRRRGRVKDISMRLQALQTRRIARQTKDLAVDTRYMIRAAFDIQDRLDVIERRIGASVPRRQPPRD